MLKKIATIGVMALVWQSAHASNWIEVNPGSIPFLYVDRSSITHAGPFVKFWSKIRYTAPQSNAYQFKPFIEYDALNVINCGTRTIGVKQFAKFDESGSSAGTWSAPNLASLTFSEIIPDTFDDFVANYVCNLHGTAKKGNHSNHKSKIPI